MIRNARTQAELERKREMYKKMLELKSELNNVYTESMNKKYHNIKLDIKEPPPAPVNSEKELLDDGKQRGVAYANLKTLVNEEDTLEFLSHLDFDEIRSFNRYFKSFKDDLEGVSGLSPLYLSQLWGNFRSKITASKPSLMVGLELQKYKEDIAEKGEKIISMAGDAGLNVDEFTKIVEDLVEKNDGNKINKLYNSILMKPRAAVELDLEALKKVLLPLKEEEGDDEFDRLMREAEGAEEGREEEPETEEERAERERREAEMREEEERNALPPADDLLEAIIEKNEERAYLRDEIMKVDDDISYYSGKINTIHRTYKKQGGKPKQNELNKAFREINLLEKRREKLTNELYGIGRKLQKDRSLLQKKGEKVALTYDVPLELDTWRQRGQKEDETEEEYKDALEEEKEAFDEEMARRIKAFRDSERMVEPIDEDDDEATKARKTAEMKKGRVVTGVEKTKTLEDLEEYLDELREGIKDDKKEMRRLRRASRADGIPIKERVELIDESNEIALRVGKNVQTLNEISMFLEGQDAFPLPDEPEFEEKVRERPIRPTTVPFNNFMFNLAKTLALPENKKYEAIRRQVVQESDNGRMTYEKDGKTFSYNAYTNMPSLEKQLDFLAYKNGLEPGKVPAKVKKWRDDNPDYTGFSVPDVVSIRKRGSEDLFKREKAEQRELAEAKIFAERDERSIVELKDEFERARARVAYTLLEVNDPINRAMEKALKIPFKITVPTDAITSDDPEQVGKDWGAEVKREVDAGRRVFLKPIIDELDAEVKTMETLVDRQVRSLDSDLGVLDLEKDRLGAEIVDLEAKYTKAKKNKKSTANFKVPADQRRVRVAEIEGKMDELTREREGVIGEFNGDKRDVEAKYEPLIDGAKERYEALWENTIANSGALEVMEDVFTRTAQAYGKYKRLEEAYDRVRRDDRRDDGDEGGFGRDEGGFGRDEGGMGRDEGDGWGLRRATRRKGSGNFAPREEIKPVKKAATKIKMKKQKDKYVEFGKYRLNHRSLGAGLIDVRSPCNLTLKRLGRIPVTSKMVKLLEELIDTGSIDNDVYNKLDRSEQEILHRVLDTCQIDAGIFIPKTSEGEGLVTQKDKDINRYQILYGELAAGNNSKEIIAELKKLIVKFIATKQLDAKNGKEFLYQLDLLE